MQAVVPEPSHSAVVESHSTLRPAPLTKRAASFTAEAQETFSEFPVIPTRLILSASFFN